MWGRGVINACADHLFLVAICHHIFPGPHVLPSLPHSAFLLAFPSALSLNPLISVFMDAHARSLLGRLNTSASPRPLKSSSIPDSPTTSATPAPGVVQNAPSAHSPRLSTKQPNIGESEDGMSVKDLLDSARQRSRESSHAGLESVQFISAEPSAAAASSPSIATKIDQDGPPQLSDGCSSGNADDTFETPIAGSIDSSVVSNTDDCPRAKSGSEAPAPPQGRRIPPKVSELIILSPMKPDLPRLQIGTDSSGRTFSGDGIEQIANLARTFGVYEREIIGATNKYIVYALKGCCAGS